MLLRHITTRFAGFVILIAGVWGGLAPFIGPYWHFVLGPDHAWHYTNARLYLSVLPGAAAALGGLILIGWGPRLTGKVGALLALAGGAWFAVGPDISRLWHSGGAQGVAHGSGTARALEYVTFHTGIGVLIVAFAAFALPGLLTARAVEADAAVGAGAGAVAADGVERHRERRREGEAIAADDAATRREPVGARTGAGTDEPTAGREGDRPVE
jgi:hypothetical protein